MSNFFNTKFSLRQMRKLNFIFMFLYFVFAGLVSSLPSYGSELSTIGLSVIPYPQEVTLGGADFILTNNVELVLDKNHSAKDRFAAEELAKDLKEDWNIDVQITSERNPGCIILTRSETELIPKDQGYRLTTSKGNLIISAKDEAGLFYGSQTLLQLIQQGRNGLKVPGLKIIDWPDIAQRAVHYDTKHHQDKTSYVKKFIKDLSKYKINILVWEWEDKFAYPSHPEIGAPGAFTMSEMQEFTRFAQKYHIQLVPLVQGLGHVSFLLKWPQHEHLREIPSSNWEFCPLKEGSYDLLFDLWTDAIEATPGSEYIHIGSDETYELATCDQCRTKAEEIGKSGLYLLFINRGVNHLQEAERKVMAWERPMGWERSNSPAIGISPAKGLVITESYSYMTPDFQYVKEAKSLGFEIFAYDPNPGTTALFLPYFYRVMEGGKVVHGSLENSYNLLSSAAVSGAFDGMINTSWDDAGLHNQMWMLSFITSAEYSWSGHSPTLPEFKTSFFKSYYGSTAINMEELFYLLNEGAYYYMSTFERNVWHYGQIGKTHLPDLPRDDALEYDPFWNAEYIEMIARSRDELARIVRALQIIENNKELHVKNLYDFELFRSIAELIQHTCQTYIDLSNLENTITKAHRSTFIYRHQAYNELVNAGEIVEKILKRRETVYNNLVDTWEETRLPKGYSSKQKNYYFQQDRARHFANRRADMSFLIYDEQLLNLEGYLVQLRDYTEKYRKD